MTLRSLRERARAIVQQTLLSDTDPEVDRTLVAGAIVARDRDHFRIERGAESPEDLERVALLAQGMCDCGGLLSTRAELAHCRSCGREFDL